MSLLRTLLWLVTGISLGCMFMALAIYYDKTKPYEVTWWPPKDFPAHDVSPP